MNRLLNVEPVTVSKFTGAYRGDARVSSCLKTSNVILQLSTHGPKTIPNRDIRILVGCFEIVGLAPVTVAVLCDCGATRWRVRNDEFLAGDVDFNTNMKRGAVVVMLGRCLELHVATGHSIVKFAEGFGLLLDTSNDSV
ncbi:hypothetical protein CfE428DRAFT_3262 [Chthoniobacter flavus Ellin428]|uniref:Uncharacterized protein n=1 Tax=Chthoniobacter flavus Ellin428 TaxID=497964 RepID=B4D2X4_9BACT|nr:hypothetical protein [Chthoniobacter flavus]EDY19085.1 hypothetical protein CfE428DRAFT_3262 [Chthoniobacter flavus Ellin428]TCO86846.1 hypothetical protein EV701_12663 [Chthoniobacter flavus]